MSNIIGKIWRSKQAVKASTATAPNSSRPFGETVLIVSNRKAQCGIQQYGRNIYQSLQKSRTYDFRYIECSDEKELTVAFTETDPRVIIYNYYPLTMPWLHAEITRKLPVKQLGIMHEVTQEEADNADNRLFDYHLCPDPTLIENNPAIFKTPRLIPSYQKKNFDPKVVTIGSFGFGFSDKGFERIIETVQAEFDQANILLRLPFNDLVDVDGKNHALATASRCREIIKKSKVKLTIKHNFITKSELLDFLAGNTINCFFYDVHKDRGISSTIEHALAVRRPLAITRCGMFRHVYNAKPSICIEDSSLKQIIANGVVPLEPFYEQWSEDNFIAAYEKILDTVLCQDKISAPT